MIQMLSSLDYVLVIVYDNVWAICDVKQRAVGNPRRGD